MQDLQKVAVKVSVITLIVNAILVAFKLFAGIFDNSYALISDAIHSASDVFSTVIVLIGVKIASKKADKNHPFGHERFECVAAMLLAVVLAATGAGVGYSGIDNIVSGEYESFAVPGVIALVAAAVSIVVKEWMFWYTYIAAKKVNSSALKADAWHHRSDALSSIGSLAGVIGGLCGVKILDSIACIVISLFILKVSVQICIDAIKKMTDEACDEKTERQIKDFIADFNGVRRLDSLLTRMFGNRIYVIAEIACDGEMPLVEAHAIAEAVHDGIEEHFPLIKHVTVHVNPYSLAELVADDENAAKNTENTVDENKFSKS